MRAHTNNIGLLRLLFASLVIIGHAPEMIDGNRSREPLTLLFHSVSLGELSVDAFFLLSGYLITKSMVRGGSLPHYFERRIFRIYPAFVVAFAVCAFGLGTLLRVYPWQAPADLIIRFIALSTPPIPPNFSGTLPVPALNGAMWSIGYEFRCYLIVALLWKFGLLERRGTILGLTLAGLALSVARTFPAVETLLGKLNHFGPLTPILGDFSLSVRMYTIFAVGMCFYLYRDELERVLNAPVAIACTVATVVLLFFPHVAEQGLVTFGAVLLFWLGLRANLGPAQKINDSWDISYGTYLYGWPVALLILWYFPGTAPWQLAAAALPLAYVAGAISWWGLERYAKDLRIFDARPRPLESMPPPSQAA